MSNEAAARTALKALRARCTDRYGAERIEETGITLTIRFRGEQDARSFVAQVEAAGGDVWECRKTHRAKFTGDRTWRVEFTIGIDEDLYLAGRVSLREVA